MHYVCAYCIQTKKALVEIKPLASFDAKSINFTLIRHFPNNLFRTHTNTL